MRDAVEVTRALAREHGLDCEPCKVAERSNLVLHLDPHALIARVALATSEVRVGVAWLRREVDIARFLDARGERVTRPARSLPAGPHERSRYIVSFWEGEHLTGRPIPREAGASLARIHRALRELPHEHVPTWGGWLEAAAVLERARGAMTASERSRVERAWLRAERIVASARARTASFQAVHGDAHLGNVLATARGALWTDWEDAFVGPIEWDLACLRSRLALFGEEREAIEAAIAAYDEPLDRSLVDDLALCRNLQVIPWLAVFAERDPSLRERMSARIARLP